MWILESVRQELRICTSGKLPFLLIDESRRSFLGEDPAQKDSISENDIDQERCMPSMRSSAPKKAKINFGCNLLGRVHAIDAVERTWQDGFCWLYFFPCY